jgi:hypothetical protein
VELSLLSSILNLFLPAKSGDDAARSIISALFFVITMRRGGTQVLAAGKSR